MSSKKTIKNEKLFVISEGFRVHFPGEKFTMSVSDKNLNAVKKAVKQNGYVLLVPSKSDEINLLVSSDLENKGAVVRIKQMVYFKDNVIAEIDCESEKLVKIENTQEEDDTFFGYYYDIKDKIDIKTSALFNKLLEKTEKYLDNNRLLKDKKDSLFSIEDPSLFIYKLMSFVRLNNLARKEIFISKTLNEFIKNAILYISEESKIKDIDNSIELEIKRNIAKLSKEQILKEKLNVIKKRLGSENEDNDVNKNLKKLESLKGLIEESDYKKLEDDIYHYGSLMPGSGDYSIYKLYLETVFSLPWDKFSNNEINIRNSEKVLNKDHYGLNNVKTRIIEYISVLKLSKNTNSRVLLLLGPPGVGKTSIAKSIAKSLNRKYARISVGGVYDESEIRGHRKTYIGAMPGRIITAIKRAGEKDSVFLIDELDKISANNIHGNPEAALLEIFDPEQNKYFIDHYLEIPFDLSKVLFICTANTIDTIDDALLDRLDIIEISGYTEEEKVQIALKYLVKKNIEQTGLSKYKPEISEKAIVKIIKNYTRESGVRNLENNINSILRKITVKVNKITESNKTEKEKAAEIKKILKVNEKDVEKLLGNKKILDDEITLRSNVGEVRGLAYTPYGGSVLSIETLVSVGTGKLSLTGSLGEVMKESAATAIGYLKSLLGQLGLEEDYFDKHDISIHVPEGAVSKDGPSAGITLFLSVLSAITKIKAYGKIAMTGEITLTGKILAIGGLKEKCLAAYRLGITNIIVPASNLNDIDEIPKSIRSKIKFTTIKNAKEAINLVLLEDPFLKSKNYSKNVRIITKTNSHLENKI